MDFNSISCPPSTAPNALRNWTPTQKSLLETSKTGRRLLQAESKQRECWTNKYSSPDILKPNDRDVFTLQQFFWAMEAVHSRAFRGDFGIMRENSNDNSDGKKRISGRLRAWASTLTPLAAGAIGLNFLLQPDEQYADIIAVGCAVVAFAPVILNMIADRNEREQLDAVLLPFIDSANHANDADSVIEYDPIRDEFSLSVGQKCLKKEQDGRTQLYVSYGLKSDAEWLLNYGFLPGVNDCVEEETGESFLDEGALRDRQRRRLAEAFVDRNP